VCVVKMCLSLYNLNSDAELFEAIQPEILVTPLNKQVNKQRRRASVVNDTKYIVQ
jgi:hypothetical protein